jgi:hypothetical protein
MTAAFVADETIIEKYGLDTEKTFDEQFSVASIERIFFYVIAVAHYIMERMFDTHADNINTALDARLPHTTRWYRTKVLQFQHPNRALITDTDKYDNSGLPADEIEELQVVKYCSVEEKQSKLLIKVAKGAAGVREILSDDEAAALDYYVGEIKDAGVPYRIVNQQADRFYCNMEVFYNPMLLAPSDAAVETAIKEYVSNLDFNGAYANAWLTDRIQQIPGVVIPHLIEVKTARAANPPETVSVRTIAESGYFIVENDGDLTITYTPYE